MPKLTNVILTGASRHKIKKGFILVSLNNEMLPDFIVEKIIIKANAKIKEHVELNGYAIYKEENSNALLTIHTPFVTVYNAIQRAFFIENLIFCTNILQYSVSTYSNCQLIAAGLNPFSKKEDQNQHILCSDTHLIEIFDEGEIERTFNLFRQFLPELIAITSHSGIADNEMKRDFSYRMSINPSSILPRYLSQFTNKQIHKLKIILRKKYGIGDLHQMDIDPLAGSVSPDRKEPMAIGLRFVDAQTSYAFIRAQIILFQTIAMYGRDLTMNGKRLPYMNDAIIDENKSIAVQNGPTAILKPDMQFAKRNTRTAQHSNSYLFHDLGKPEKATNSLLRIINGVLLPFFRDMSSSYEELSPLLLGLELRNRNEKCFVNYAEYQKSFFTQHKDRKDYYQSYMDYANYQLDTHDNDIIFTSNQLFYPQLALEIKKNWEKKLQPILKKTGWIKSYNGKEGEIVTEQNEYYLFLLRDLPNHVTDIEQWQPVSFIPRLSNQEQLASKITFIQRVLFTGRVTNFTEKGTGTIKCADFKDNIFFYKSDILNGDTFTRPTPVTFEIIKNERGTKAVRIKIQKGNH